MISKNRNVLALFFALAVIIFPTTLSIAFEPSSTQVVQSFDRNIFYIGQVLQVLILFVIPALLIAYATKSDKLRYFNLFHNHNLGSIQYVFLLVMFALPIIAVFQYYNLQMHLPDRLYYLEVWMKAKEDEIANLTKFILEDTSTTTLLLNLLVVAMLAGFAEELFFRGLLQQSFIDAKVNKHVAVWLTAILFSALHLQFYGFFARMLLGALLGYTYLFTQNLWVPILMHTFNNGLSVFLTHLQNSKAIDTSDPKSLSSQMLDENTQANLLKEHPIHVAFSLVMFCVVFYGFYRYCKINNNRLLATINDEQSPES